MKLFAFLLLSIPAALAAIGDRCTHSLGTGTCQYTSSCTTGYTVTGACPRDPANVKCCTQKSCSTPPGSGTCRNTSTSCSGRYIPGYCPGDSTIRCCVSPSSTGAKVLTHAMSQAGLPYSWGGGGCSGKSLGIESGASTVGFDCSGLTQYAVCQATNMAKKIPRTTYYQYGTGTRVALANRQIGDLLYYGTGGDCSCNSAGYCAKIHHTAIWAGNGMMFEAQQTGTQLGLHPLRTTNLCPYAIRHW